MSSGTLSMHLTRSRRFYYPSPDRCKHRAMIEDNESDRESDDITPGDL